MSIPYIHGSKTELARVMQVLGQQGESPYNQFSNLLEIQQRVKDDDYTIYTT